MSTPDVAGLLCHCDQTGHLPADGHPLGTPGCASEVKAGARENLGWCSRDHYYSVCSCHGSVYGTCRECGRRVKVVKVETRGTWDVFPRLPGETKAGYDRRRVDKFGHAGVRGPLLQVMPAIAPHRDCPGAGQPPAETRYAPGRLLAEWVKANGDERLVER